MVMPLSRLVFTPSIPSTSTRPKVNLRHYRLFSKPQEPFPEELGLAT